jgi:hypothetical protein
MNMRATYSKQIEKELNYSKLEDALDIWFKLENYNLFLL